MLDLFINVMIAYAHDQVVLLMVTEWVMPHTPLC